MHFIERIGAMCASTATMLAPRPVFPPGHPRHGTRLLAMDESAGVSFAQMLTVSDVAHDRRTAHDGGRGKEPRAARAHFPVYC